MVGIIDYGVGNLFSLKSSLKYIGVDCILTHDPEKIRSCEKLILPGVGAFGDAATLLSSTNLDRLIIEEVKSGKPLLGICLGMQLLYESSCEYGNHKGLGLIKGHIKAFAAGGEASGVKIPHMGWNTIEVRNEHPLFKYVKSGEYVYYVHSYYAPVTEATLASSSYGGANITGAAAVGNLCGCQFHPEKSGETGLNILRGFAGMNA